MIRVMARLSRVLAFAVVWRVGTRALLPAAPPLHTWVAAGRLAPCTRALRARACAVEAALLSEVDEPWEEIDEVAGGVILDMDEGLEPGLGQQVSDDVTALLKGANVPDAQVSLTLCDDTTITELNAKWRGKDQPTDVLSFPLDDEVMLGDLVISVDTAAKQAEARGHSVRDELRVLLVHGLLHLLGYDHETGADDLAEMAEAEQRLLRRLGWRGDGLVAAAGAEE